MWVWGRPLHMRCQATAAVYPCLGLDLPPPTRPTSFHPRPLAFLRSDKQRGRSPLPHRRLHLIHFQRPCISSHVAVSHHFTSQEYLSYSGLCLNHILSFAACYPSHHLIYHADRADPSQPSPNLSDSPHHGSLSNHPIPSGNDVADGVCQYHPHEISRSAVCSEL